MANNPKITTVMNKVSDAQLENIASGGTITKGSDTLTADEGAMYLTPDTSVSYEEQSLTSEQQAQARTNIGAGTSNINEIWTAAVKYNNPVQLTPDANGKITIPVASNAGRGGVVRAVGDYQFGIAADEGTLYIPNASSKGFIASRYNGWALSLPDLNAGVKAALSDANHLTMTSSEQAIAQAVLGITDLGIHLETVATLPTASSTTWFDTSKTIYLAPNSSQSSGNIYDEFVTIRSGEEGSYTYSWEQIGSTEVDLSNYVPKNRTIAGVDLQDDITQSEMQTALDVVTKSDAQTITGKKTFSGNIAVDSQIDMGTGAIKYSYNNINFNLNGNDIYLFASSTFQPNGSTNSNKIDLGGTNRYWKDFYLAGNLTDGTNSISISGICDKVDKTTDSNKVYGTDGNGNQTTYGTSAGGIAQGKVPIYDSNGCLHTLTPYFSYDAVNKGYVDNLSNPNLLINGNFRVNQRSQASYSAVGYTVDRWRMSGTIRTVTPIDAGLQISGGLAGGTTFLTQRLEDTPKMWGKTFSISMTMTDGSFISSTFTLPSSAPSEDADYGATDTLIDLGLRIRLHYYSSSGLLAFVIDCQNTVQDYIEYVKLEIGSIATPFSPRTYAEELALCQRYYQTALYEFSFFAQTTSLGYGHINLPVTMRTLPTATFPTGYIHGGDGYLGNPTSIRIEGSLKSNAIRFAIGQTFVQNRLYMLESSNLIELDAELY